MADADADVAALPGVVLPFGQLQGKQAFQAWSETVASVFDTDISAPAVDDFKFGFSAWNFGQLIVGISESVGHRFQRSPSTVARSGVDHYLVQVYEHGCFAGDAHGAEVDVEAGDIWFADMSRTVRTETSDFRNTSVVIPRSLLAPLLPDPDAVHNLRLPANSPLGGLLGRYLIDLSARAPRMNVREALSVADATVHLVAGCIGPSAVAAALGREAIATARLTAIRSHIEAGLADPNLGADAICRHFGLSRAALYRLFEPLGGVQEYIRRRRLGRCFYEIAAPRQRSRRISEIAHSWGFTNDASFSRAFRRAFGISPSELRAAGDARFACLRESGAPQSVTEGELSRWVRELMRL